MTEVRASRAQGGQDTPRERLKVSMETEMTDLFLAPNYRHNWPEIWGYKAQVQEIPK